MLRTIHQTHTGTRFASVGQRHQLCYHTSSSNGTNEHFCATPTDQMTYLTLDSGPMRLSISWRQNISKNISEVGPGIHGFRLCGRSIGLIALSTFLELRPTTLRIVVDFIVSS